MFEAKRTILIVDDDRSILRVFTRVLEKKGYIVTAVETGKDALNQIEHNRFDAALIDLRLSDMAGTEILPTLQKVSPKTVKIIFTGSPDMPSFDNGQAKNMDAFLLKPVRPEVILGILDEKLKAA
jgi:two-component system, NtrC family, response regulator GlrR